MRQLYYGDNLDIMQRYIKDETVDLCYIDPPFNSKRTYNQIYNNIGKEDRAQVQAFVDTWRWDDKAIEGFGLICSNYNGLFTRQTIQLIIGLEKVLSTSDLFAYLISMTLRITEIQRVLKKTGTFYLHCDPTASHYLKILIDSIFVAKGGVFRNEIVWCYRGAGYPKKDFGRRHDIIYRYSKTKDFTFNLDAVREEYAETTKERFSHYIGNKRGKIDFGVQTLNPLGKQPDDWWEIQPIAPSAKERLGYQTQKPEKLLEKIISASSNEGDLVLDAYCGCGTSVAVAEHLKRNWIGIDITYQSISLILKRLEKQYGASLLPKITLTGIPKDFESAIALAHKQDDRVRKEFEKWCVLTYSNNRAIISEKKGGDKGIDGMAFVPDSIGENRNEYKTILFSVKSDKTLTPNYIRDLRGTMDREGAVMGVLITLYEPTDGMKAEAKIAGKYYNKLVDRQFDKIMLITAKEIINGAKLPISANLEIAVTKSAEKKTGLGQSKLSYGGD